ncbi:MAG: hypothetical protein ACKPJF_04445, partial [Dolichospermum sp.]
MRLTYPVLISFISPTKNIFSRGLKIPKKACLSTYPTNNPSERSRKCYNLYHARGAWFPKL